MRIIRTLYVIPLLAAALLRPATVGAGAVEIKPGDHISIIGNTLADRMQHDGWLETRLQARFAGHNLVIRNLGFSGDELTLRLRSADFGTPDQWLTNTKTDVIFAFFGYNESFAGTEGLAPFKKEFRLLTASLRRPSATARRVPADPPLVLLPH